MVYWSEMRFDEAGRYVVCTNKIGQEGFTDHTPTDFNARTRVHEYGGGAFFIYDGQIFFTNFADQMLYVQKDGEKPKAVGPTTRHADGEYNPKVLKNILLLLSSEWLPEGEFRAF